MQMSDKTKSRVRGKRCRLIAGLTAMLLCLGTAVPETVSFAAEVTDSLGSQVQAAETALRAAQENQKAAAEKYDQGSLGFIDWMLARQNLTEPQKKDLNRARKVITDACEENFSKWDGGSSTGLPAKRNNMVTCLWDLYDAASLKNLKESFSILKNINEIRAADKNYVGEMHRNAAGTNFYFMAVAQTGADRGAGLKRHSLLQVACENLAFGASSPAQAWRSEINVFNAIKESLGMTVLSKESDAEAVEKLADKQGKEVGHYTNLFWSVDQVMGAGFTNYGGTSCYNAGKSSDYIAEYAIYTIDEFEALFDEYYATVDPDILQAAVDAAQRNLQELLNRQYGECSSHVFGDGIRQEATCTEKGGTVYTCTKCGYKKIENEIEALGHNFVDGVCSRCKITAPKNITSISWTVGNSSNLTYNQSYEVGQDVKISIRFQSASEYPLNDKFTIAIADPTILSYKPATNSTGTMHMERIGKTTVTIYPTENPSLSKTYEVSVTDVGGHDYVIKQAAAGAGKTTKVCSKCGATEEVTLPTEITRVTWWKNSSGIYSPGNYQIGDEVKLEVEYYSPADHVDNSEFIVDVSNPSVAAAEASNEWRYQGVLKIIGNGDATVTVYAKYDPSVKKEYKLHVGKDTENAGDKSTETPSTEKTNETDQTSQPNETDQTNQAEKPDMSDQTDQAADKAGQPDETDENSQSDNQEQNVQSAGGNIGKTVVKGSYSYSIASASTVSISKFSNKNAAKAVVPKTVKIEGKTYKVTSIGKSAFKGCSKLSKVTVGKNVTKIGANAFMNCKKLSSITIKSTKLKSAGKNALKGIKANAKIKVPAGRLKAYQTLLKGKGQGKNVKVVKVS